MKIKPATQHDRDSLDNAIRYLKHARNQANDAQCPKVAAKIKSALKSADGARRPHGSGG